MVVAYSEMIPFIAVGYGLYLLLTLRSWKANPGRGLAVLGMAAAVMLILLNRFLGLATIYMLGQFGRVPSEDPVTTLFPYYMIPSGPVFFWGMYPLGQTFPNVAWLSFLVASSLVFSAVVALLVVRSAWRRQAPAVLCLVMIAVFAALFHKGSGFGMYKLAMYCQPFILTALVVGWISLWRRRAVQILPLVALGLLGARTHFSYVATSLGEGSGAFSEIPNASSTHLVREYANILAANPGRPVEVDAWNVVLAKFQMLESRDRAATFPSNNFLGNFGEVIAPTDLIGPEAAQRAGQIYRDFLRLYPRRLFDLHPDSLQTAATDPFRLDLVAQHAATADHPLLFIAETGRQAPFNRWREPQNVAGNFRSGGIESFGNHLVFIASRLGEPYYTAYRYTVATYQLETDLLFPDSTMAGMGRFLLFEIINPSPTVRLEMSLTDSLAGDHENRLPSAAAIGAERLSLPMMGRGSARVFSPPLTPQLIDGRQFVCVDMGGSGTVFKYKPGGLMKLWGQNVSLDHRQIVAFVRDVSLISENEYQVLAAPRGIQNFPQDLMNPHLEYSGIYEDGWIGDKGFLLLSQPPGPGRVVCRAIVPKISENSFSTEIVMRVDGKEVARKTVGLGDVELAADLPPATARRRIELSFSKIQHLPDPDNRPVGAELKAILIEAAPIPNAAPAR
jgi:hypothetical protein